MEESVQYMSFTKQIKEEVSLLECEDIELNKALLSGFIKINSHLVLRNNEWIIVIKSENVKVAKQIIKLLKDIYGVDSRIAIRQQKKFKVNNDAKIIQAEISKNCKEILKDLEIYNEHEGFNASPLYLVKNPELQKYYLRGCFMATGSCNSPTTNNYHLEISTDKEEVANMLVKLMKKFYLQAKVIQRRNQFVTYIKKSDQIADFLNVIGATNSFFNFEDIRMQRDQVNSLNRLVNCEVSNAQKAMETGIQQADEIRWFKDNIGFTKLDSKLIPIAQVRLANPEATYNELIDDLKTTFNITISKPGFAYRMKKILDLVKTLRGSHNE